MCSHYRPPDFERLKTFHPFAPTRQLEYPPDAWPGYAAPFLINEGGGMWVAGSFGLVPYWADPKLARSTYNARSETIAEKPSFRRAWKERRLCIIPASCIFEPCYETGRAVPWRIGRADGEPFGVAGIWERRAGDEGVTRWSCSMLTINADEHPLMSRFHKPADEKRSVVILSPADYDQWLTAKNEAELRELLKPFDMGLFVATCAGVAPAEG